MKYTIYTTKREKWFQLVVLIKDVMVLNQLKTSAKLSGRGFRLKSKENNDEKCRLTNYFITKER